MQGSLTNAVLPNLLKELYVGRESGMLHIEQQPAKRSFCFFQGEIVNGCSDLEQESLGEFLAAHETISRSDLERASKKAADEDKRLGAVFQELQILDREGVDQAVAAHACAVLERVVTCCDGSYRFEKRDSEVPPEGESSSKIPTGDLILEVVRQVKDPAGIRQALGDVEQILAPSSDSLRRSQNAALTPAHGYILSRVDGTLSLGELIDLSPVGAEEAERCLLGLLVIGLVEPLPAPGKAASPTPPGLDAAREEAPPPTPKEVPTDDPSRTQALAAEGHVAPVPAAGRPVAEGSNAGFSTAEASASETSASETSAPEVPASEAPASEVPASEAPASEVSAPEVSAPEVSAPEAPTPEAPTPEISVSEVPEATVASGHRQRQQVLELFQGLNSLTHFELLGVARKCQGAELRRAYFQLVERCHPGMQTDLDLSDLQYEIVTVFNRAAEAFRVLADPHARTGYEGTLARSRRLTPDPHQPAAPAPVAPAPAAPTPVVPAPVAPAPVAPAPVAPAPAASTPAASTPAAPTPAAPTPVAPTPVAPTPVVRPPVVPAPVTPAPVTAPPAARTPAASFPAAQAPVSPRQEPPPAHGHADRLEQSSDDVAKLAQRAIRRAEKFFEAEEYWDAIQLAEANIPKLSGKWRNRARLVLAKSMLKNPKWVKQGEEELRKVVSEDPSNVEVLLQLGQIYHKQGLKARATSMLQKAVSLQPDLEAKLVELEMLPPPSEDEEGSKGILGKLFRKGQ